MYIFTSLLAIMSTLIVNNHNGPTYHVLQKQDNYELRRYDSWIVAETIIEGTHQDAGSEAFSRLGGYIFGKNEGGVKIEMTAPVTQYQVGPGKFAVQFYMPAEWTLESLPKPNDSRVVLKQVPERTLFAVRYNGDWSEHLYQKQEFALLKEAEAEKVSINLESQPIWARYNSPMAPTFLRTNEVLYEVKA